MHIPLFAADPTASPPADPLGDTLKLVQIVFYTVAGIVAVLTYIAARRAWLTPTNTEYQKKVLERLAKLSEDLYCEFDPASETHWSKGSPVRDAIRDINRTFENNRDEVLEAKKWYYGTPYSADIRRLTNLLHPIRSDPFIPENIRDAVVDLLENRLAVLNGLYIAEFEKYAASLARGKQQPLDPDSDEDLEQVNKIHNRINAAKNERGCGVTSIENAVHDIRGLIQDYFDQFNPHGVGKGRRKKHERTPDDEERNLPPPATRTGSA